MGIDFGGKRIGIAFSDLSGTIATGFEVYQSRGREKDLEHLALLAKQKEVVKVVFGLPLNADGSESQLSLLTQAFASDFANKTNLPVDFEDERFTSLDADEILKQSKELSWQERKKLLDMVAAEIILQNYLDKNKRSKKL